MNFFQKLKEKFLGYKEKISFELNFDKNKNKIELTSNFNINEDERIVELIEIYNIPVVGNSIYLDYEEIYNLYYDDKGYPDNTYRFFDLPPLFNGYLFIENKGNFVQDKDVIYQFYFQDTNGKYFLIKNNIIRNEATGDYRILPKKIYELVKELIKYNSDSQ